MTSVTRATCRGCLLTIMACLFLIQQTVSGNHVCTSPFEEADNDPNACFLHVPKGTKDKMSYCLSFDHNADIQRKTPIQYQENMDICFYHLDPPKRPEGLEDGCCPGGGLPPGR